MRISIKLAQPVPHLLEGASKLDVHRCIGLHAYKIYRKKYLASYECTFGQVYRPRTSALVRMIAQG